MTALDLAEIVYQNLDPADTAIFAEALKEKIINGQTSEIAKEIADRLEAIGITITGLPCKRSPM